MASVLRPASGQGAFESHSTNLAFRIELALPIKPRVALRVLKSLLAILARLLLLCYGEALRLAGYGAALTWSFGNHVYQSDICDGEANSDDDEETKKAALEEQSRPKVGGVGGGNGGEAEFFPKKGVEA